MPQIKLTIPDDIYKIIKENAKENYRTISSEINFRLAKTIKPGVNSTPALHYPEGVRSTNPIPETPYKITCDSTTQETKPQQETTKPRPKYKRIIGGTEEDYENYVKEQKEKQEEEARMTRRRIIGSPEPEEENKTIESTPMRSYTSTKTADGHSKHPLVWLDENDIDPNDLSESSYNILTAQYPDVSINDFVNYQHQRQNRYTPDPNDPYDVMTNNPYLRNR